MGEGRRSQGEGWKPKAREKAIKKGINPNSTSVRDEIHMTAKTIALDKTARLGIYLGLST